jgi:hypothetical protein
MANTAFGNISVHHNQVQVPIGRTDNGKQVLGVINGNYFLFRNSKPNLSHLKSLQHFLHHFTTARKAINRNYHQWNHFIRSPIMLLLSKSYQINLASNNDQQSTS